MGGGGLISSESSVSKCVQKTKMQLFNFQIATATSVKPRPKTLIYTKETMQAACRAVLNDKKGLREAAREHGVPSSTLRDRLRGKRCFHEVSNHIVLIINLSVNYISS